MNAQSMANFFSPTKKQVNKVGNQPTKNISKRDNFVVRWICEGGLRVRLKLSIATVPQKKILRPPFLSQLVHQVLIFCWRWRSHSQLLISSLGGWMLGMFLDEPKGGVFFPSSRVYVSAEYYSNSYSFSFSLLMPLVSPKRRQSLKKPHPSKSPPSFENSSFDFFTWFLLRNAERHQVME